MLNRSGETIDDCLIPGEWFQFFPIKYDVGYKFVIYSLYNVEVHSSTKSLLRAFIMTWCFILKAFSASIEIIKWFFFLFC
jgi:hypothetical protein